MSTGLILYLIFVTIYLDVLFLAHRYIFTKYSFLKWDRLYFLGIVIFSFALPFIPVPNFIEISAQQAQLHHIISRIDISGGISTVNTEKNLFNPLKWAYYITIAYSIGFTLKSLKFIIQLYHTIRITRKAEKTIWNNQILYKVKAKDVAFTFMNKICVSEKFFELAPSEQQKILMHEKTHLSQKHSVDILIADIAGIILWFNPLNKAILDTMKSVHEFLADESTIEAHNKQEYMQLLLNMAIKDEELKPVNYFARLNLRKRFEIMQRLGSKIRFKRLFISSLPVIALLFFSMSFSNQLFTVFPIFQADKLSNPFGKQYKVALPYFKLEQNKQHYRLSHEKMAVELPDYSPIVSPMNAIVSEIKHEDNWGVSEFSVALQNGRYTILFEGLEKLEIKVKEKVSAKDTIGYSGKKALYPTVKIAVFEDGKSVSPEKLIKF